jgi:hypothetical protein
MKNTVPNKVKDYYTEAEISKLTLDDLNDPDVWNAVRNSMTQNNIEIERNDLNERSNANYLA